MSQSEKLSCLRGLLKKHKLDGYLLKSTDSHFNEYVSNFDKRVEFISGFTGSAAEIIVTVDKAYLWTDSRYFIQAEEELSKEWTLMKLGISEESIMQWMKNNEGLTIGTDPNLFQFSMMKIYKLYFISPNLIDEVRSMLGQMPLTLYKPIRLLDEKFTGQAASKKLLLIREKLCGLEASAVVISSMPNIAWIINCRGSDIDYNPLFRSYMIVTANKAIVFLKEEMLETHARTYILKAGITIMAYSEENIGETIKSLFAQYPQNSVILQKSANVYLGNLIGAERLSVHKCPIDLMQAIKNVVELKGFIDCHVQDGMAICRYLCWLEKNLKNGIAIDEYQGAQQLSRFRESGKFYQGESFPTISSSGKNSAIVHYAPKPEGSKTISPNEIYLLDSGGHYLNGTTDTTRTVHFGIPKSEEKFHFTLVLKGNIALSCVKFPWDTCGKNLDILARMHLYAHGLDYGHGTGHGVGHYLCVHEGPQTISYREGIHVPLEIGMVVSNEPGYYIKDKYGIRIENVMCVIPAEIPESPGKDTFMEFRTVTMVPIQTKLIEKTLLSSDEIQWVNSYNREVYTKIASLLDKQSTHDKETLAWLFENTRPL